MRNLTFYCVGLLMILIQTNFYRFLGPLHDITLGELPGYFDRMLKGQIKGRAVVKLWKE